MFLFKKRSCGYTVSGFLFVKKNLYYRQVMLAMEETYACGGIDTFCRLLCLPRERWKSPKAEQKPLALYVTTTEYLHYQAKGCRVVGESGLMALIDLLMWIQPFFCFVFGSIRFLAQAKNGHFFYHKMLQTFL
jgi:hypothetical protein